MQPERNAVVVCDQWLGSNGYAGMNALRRAGWSVRVVPELEYVPLHWRSVKMKVLSKALRPLAVREFNEALVRICASTRATMLLVFKGTFVLPDTLGRLGRARVKTYCFYPDNSFWAHGEHIPRSLPLYDWVFSAKTFGLADMRDQLGVTRSSLLLHGYDVDLHRPVELSAADERRYACEASFIGTWSRKKEGVLETLVAALPRLKLRVWGNQWERARPGSPLRRWIEHSPLEGVEYVRAIRASRINLAILSERRRGASADDQITSRTFHIPACGGFMIHERTAEVLRIFTEGETIVCYDTEASLPHLVTHYLTHDAERSRIIERSMSLVRREHSWDRRIAEVLQRHEALCRG